MPAKWTLMVYMAGFNSLSDFALKDLTEMRQLGSTDDVKVAVFLKRKDATQAQRLLVEREGQTEDPDLLGDVDSGRAQTLVDFIRWARNKAPAARYGLIIWNHGSGWRPDDLDALYEEVRDRGVETDFTGRELDLLVNREVGRTLFKESLAQILELPNSHARAIASDDGTGHSLDTIELSHVLEKAHADLGAPLDLLGMDACLMNNLEVAFEGSDHVRFVVGSEDVEPGDGWPYTTILQALTATPDMSGADLGKAVVKHYVASYASGEHTVTQCVIDASKISAFADRLDGLTTLLRAHIDRTDDYAEIMKAQKASPQFMGYLVDLRSFCHHLASSSIAEPVRAAASLVDESLEPGGYVVANGHVGASVDSCGGVTVYCPNPFVTISRFYGDLRFAKVHSWDEFLADYARGLG